MFIVILIIMISIIKRWKMIKIDKKKSPWKIMRRFRLKSTSGKNVSSLDQESLKLWVSSDGPRLQSGSTEHRTVGSVFGCWETCSDRKNHKICRTAHFERRPNRPITSSREQHEHRTILKISEQGEQSKHLLFGLWLTLSRVEDQVLNWTVLKT